MTLVTFALQMGADGTLLTIPESGFDPLSLDRRVPAFVAESHNWTWQCRLIEGYLANWFNAARRTGYGFPAFCGIGG